MAMRGVKQEPTTVQVQDCDLGTRVAETGGSQVLGRFVFSESLSQTNKQTKNTTANNIGRKKE